MPIFISSFGHQIVEQDSPSNILYVPTRNRYMSCTNDQRPAYDWCILRVKLSAELCEEASQKHATGDLDSDLWRQYKSDIHL